MEPYKIAITDDHALLRQSLKLVLNSKPEFSVVFEASNGQDLLNKLEHQHADLILLDLEMPIMGGYEALSKISQLYPNVKCLIISYFFEPDFVVNGLKLGAKGFLSKNSTLDVISKSIQTIMDGKIYVPAELSYLVYGSHNPSVKPNHPFSNKEMAVIRLICSGKTNKEIADFLTISVKTVENHRSNIFLKADVKNVAQLVIFAVKEGIVVT